MANDDYLHDCVLNRNTSLLVSLLDHGADVNSRNEREQTLLHSAASINYKEAIELLLNRGAKVNLHDKNGWTPLHAGARHAEVVKELLDKGASPNFKNFHSQTPLHLAVQYKNVEGVKLLINKGADINLKDNYSTSPLYIAVFNESLDIIKMLIDNGAKVNDCDVESRPAPLYIAAEHNNLTIVQLLINSGADPNIIRISPRVDCYNGYTTLHFAADNNNEAMAKLLLDSGVDVNVINAFGETALHFAARLDNCHVSKLLIERGADVNVKNKSGKTPLFAAVSGGCIENVQLLLRSGAIVNTFDHYGGTPLQELFLLNQFIYYECEEKMILLIMNGAEVNTKDKNGNTALQLAMGKGLLKYVAILLDCGASRDITTYYAETPLGVRDDLSVAEIFDKHSVKLECIRMISNQEINYERLEYFQKACVKELTIMKEIILGSHSVFSVLSKYDDPTFVKNSLLEQEISLFEDKFPIYHLILRSTFLKAKKRYNMLDEVQGYFRGSILPVEMKRKILTFLNDDDLLKIIKAVNNKEVVP